MKISVVINTYNEEKNIKRCLESVKDFADEIIVVDMHSVDGTVKIAQNYQAKIFQHERTGYVEPARNFALSKARGEWILIIDADEELPKTLADRLKEIVLKAEVDFVELPRKNLIFGKWIEYSRWWPDYLIRFFKKGKVRYSEKIHQPPEAEGKGLRMEAREENALLHYNFQSIFQFVDRINRYTDIQSSELVRTGYQFEWEDLVFKPANEFFSRFFAGEGFKDGLHGLALALLQSFSELVLYLKLWEKAGFEEKKITNINTVSLKVIHDYLFWLQKTTSGTLSKLRLRIKSQI